MDAQDGEERHAGMGKQRQLVQDSVLDTPQLTSSWPRETQAWTKPFLGVINKRRSIIQYIVPFTYLDVTQSCKPMKSKGTLASI